MLGCNRRVSTETRATSPCQCSRDVKFRHQVRVPNSSWQPITFYHLGSSRPELPVSHHCVVYDTLFSNRVCRIQIDGTVLELGCRKHSVEMIISAKDTLILSIHLRVWDVSGNLVPDPTWFNTDTMVASVPTDSSPNSECRTQISRFEFVVKSEQEATILQEILSSSFSNEELANHIELVLED